MQYRREIDGLRAVAILPVILFHAGFSTFSGGYVGVDVFFVISGYLITSLVTAEMEANTFSLARFYERRARRILPALIFVMIVCIPFALWWMRPRELREFSDSLVAVCLFVSNVLFVRESNYFATAAHLKPLLHTWSLAVEEQFYIVYPVLLWLLWRAGTKVLMIVLALGFLLSLFCAQFGGNFDFPSLRPHGAWSWWATPDWAFYLAPARAWELIVGALASFVYFGRFGSGVVASAHRLAKEFLGVLGLGMIACAVFVFDEKTPFPSFFTLVPVVGAAFIILFAGPQTAIGRILGHPVAVGIGLISYSVYLWHQPLLAFARIGSLNEPGPIPRGALVALTFVLAYGSWRFIERPFRDRKQIGRPFLVASAVAMSTLVIAAGLAGHRSKGFPGRLSDKLLATIAPSKTDEATACLPKVIDPRFPSVDACEFGEPQAQRTVALLGDSHASALFTALDSELKSRGLRGIRARNTACGPIPMVKDSRFPFSISDCQSSNAFLQRYLRENVDTMVVVIRWSYRLFPVPNEIEQLIYDNGEGGIETDDYRESYAFQDGRFTVDAQAKVAVVTDYIRSLVATGKKVILVYPIPEVGWNVPLYNWTSSRWGAIPDTISTSYSRFKQRNQFVERTLDAVGQYPNLLRVRPEEALCDRFIPQRCVAQLHGVPLYFDDDHLADSGARLVMGLMANQLGP